MSAHTPGPWRRDEDNCGGGAGLVAVSKSKSGKGGPRVAWTARVVSGGVMVISDDEAKANADLIAAAPEMFDAIQAALDEFAIGNFNAARRQRVVEFIRAAQRKARGGA